MKKKVLLMILTTIFLFYGRDVFALTKDDFTCSTAGYEVVEGTGGIYGDSNFICCPTGFSYGAKTQLGDGTGDDIPNEFCIIKETDYYSMHKKNCYDVPNMIYFMGPYSGGIANCITNLETPVAKENTSACYFCKVQNKYVYGTQPEESCTSGWTADNNISAEECANRATSNGDEEDTGEGKYMVLQCSTVRNSEEVPFFAVYSTDNDGNVVKGIVEVDLTSHSIIPGLNPLTPNCWLNDYKDIDDAECTTSEDVYSDKNKEIFNLGICPADYREDNRWFNGERVPYGQKTPVKKAKLTNYKFIAYSFLSDGEDRIIIEAYHKDGRYGYVGGDLIKSGVDEIEYQQMNILRNLYMYGEIDFFNIDNKFKTLQIAGLGNGDSDIAECENGLDDCETNHGFKILLISGDGVNLNAKNATIDKAVDNFFTDEGVTKINDFFDDNESYKTVMTNQNLIDTSKEINEQMSLNGTYQFGSYNIDLLINDLNSAAHLIDELYPLTDSLYDGKTLETYITETIMMNTFGVKDLEELRWKNKNNGEYSLNLGGANDVVYTALVELISQRMNSLEELQKYGFNFVKLQDDLDTYGSMFYETVNNLASGQFELSISQEDKINEIKEIFDRIAEEREYTFAVVSCTGLLSEALIEKINGYLNIVKIAIPIIVIILGTIDFTKAVFSGEDEMKKAQKSFIKRLAVAILIFFVPTVVNLLLQLANKVWPIIIPDSCQSEINKD